MKQSRILAAFYQEMQKVVDGGTSPTGLYGVFCAHEGLCKNLERYIDAVSCGTARGKEIKAEMQDQFFEAGLDSKYPFNSGWDWDKSEPDLSYESEAKSITMYQNPKRLKWIRDHSRELSPAKGEKYDETSDT